MANTFKNANDVIASTDTEVYTCPSDTTAIIIGSSFANVDVDDATELTIKLTDSSGAVTRTLLPATQVPVKGGYSFTPDLGKIVLEAGDSVSALSSENNAIEATLHILEIT